MKILSYGSMNIDKVYSVKHVVRQGETILAQSMGVYCGGKGLNQSIAIAKAGGEIYHAGVVGEDGGMLLEALKRYGIDATYVKQVAGASSHTVIQVDESGQNSIIVFNGETIRVLDEDIDRVLAGFSEGDLVVLQNELDNSLGIMRRAAAKGLRVVFNPSPINDNLQNYPMECVSWFLMNEIEGKALTGETEPQAILSAMAQRYPKANVVLTLGGDGAYCLYEGKTVFQPAFKVKAVDTTGAGDTFTGYLVTGISQGLPIEKAMERAARASSIAVGRKGAADAIPYAKELD